MENITVNFNYESGSEDAYGKHESGYKDIIYIGKSDKLDGGSLAVSLDEAEHIAYELLKLIDQVRSYTQ